MVKMAPYPLKENFRKVASQLSDPRERWTMMLMPKFLRRGAKCIILEFSQVNSNITDYTYHLSIHKTARNSRYQLEMSHCDFDLLRKWPSIKKSRWKVSGKDLGLIGTSCVLQRFKETAIARSPPPKGNVAWNLHPF